MYDFTTRIFGYHRTNTSTGTGYGFINKVSFMNGHGDGLVFGDSSGSNIYLSSTIQNLKNFKKLI